MMKNFASSLPFNVCLNLDLLIEFWEQQAADPTSPVAVMAEHILRDLEDVPELRGPIPDIGVLEPHRGLIARLIPQIQVFFIGLPIQIALALFVLMTVLGVVMMWYLEYFEATSGDHDMLETAP